MPDPAQPTATTQGSPPASSARAPRPAVPSQAPDARRSAIEARDVDNQQRMDDSYSEHELGDVELERRPRDAERMRLDPQPGDEDRA